MVQNYFRDIVEAYLELEKKIIEFLNKGTYEEQGPVLKWGQSSYYGKRSQSRQILIDDAILITPLLKWPEGELILTEYLQLCQELSQGRLNQIPISHMELFRRIKSSKEQQSIGETSFDTFTAAKYVHRTKDWKRWRPEDIIDLAESIESAVKQINTNLKWPENSILNKLDLKKNTR